MQLIRDHSIELRYVAPVQSRLAHHKLYLACTLATATLLASACTSVSAARVQPSTVHAGVNVHPVAAIQADAISAYVLFIPIPGGADLDRVINQLLISTAKDMGADKVTNLQFEATPMGGVWALRRLLGWRSARASGIAVQVTGTPPDPNAVEGPEPPTAAIPPSAAGSN